MTLRDPKVREAKAILAADRKAIRKARPKPVIPVAKGQRQPRKREPGFLAFLRRLPCAVGPVGCDGPVQAAHIRTPKPGEPPTGLQRKPDDTRATGLCAEHHRQQHATAEMKFWASHGKDPFAIAADLFRRFQAGG